MGIIHDRIIEAKEFEEKAEKLLEDAKFIKKEIQSYFDTKKIKTLVAEKIGDTNYRLLATKVEKIQIDYDVEKLKEKLEKSVVSRFIDKRYEISDFSGLVNLIKEAGISPAEFKKFISVNESVNKDNIKQMYSLGEISQKDLSGCYDAKLTKYIQIRRLNPDTK